MRVLILFVYVYNILHVCTSILHSSPYDGELLVALLKFYGFVQEYFSETVRNNFASCAELFNLTDKSTVDSLSLAFDYSGKYLGDYGFPSDCKLTATSLPISNTTTLPTSSSAYFLPILLIYDLNISMFNNTPEYNIMSFLNQERYYTGLCMYEHCLPFLENALNPTLNPEFLSYLDRKALGAHNFKILSERTNLSINGNVVLGNVIVWSVFIWLIVLAITIVIRLSFFFRFEYKRFKYIELSDTKIRENTHLDINKDNKDIVNSIEDALMFVFDAKENEINREYKFKHKMNNLLKFLDPFKNLKYVLSVINYYYNDNGLHCIPFIRVIIAFELTLFYSFLILRTIPPKDPFNIYFYNTKMGLLFIKISTYANISWIILDGFIMSYKLLHYIYGSLEQAFPFKLLCKYIVHTAPKAIIFISFYYFFYILSGSFTSIVGNSGNEHATWSPNLFNDFTLLLKYYKYLEIEDNVTYSLGYNITNILNPFLVRNEDYKWQSRGTLMMHIQVNEFYLFVLYTLLFYICFKLRSLLFDICVSFCVFILAFVGVFYGVRSAYESSEFNKITYYTFIGDITHEKLIYCAYTYYSLGVMGGVCLFYYNDMKYKYKKYNYCKYKPFRFYKRIMQLIKKTSFKCKYFFIICFSCVMCIVLPSIAVDFALLAMNNEYQRTYTINTYHLYKSIYKYEKVIFSMLFIVTVLLLITLPKHQFSLFNIINSKGFIFIERINTIFFCFIPFYVVYAHCVFLFQYSLKYQNILFITVGLTIFAITLSILFAIVIESYIRKSVKTLIIRDYEWKGLHGYRTKQGLKRRERCSDMDNSNDM